jgi:hypothetical protein
MRAEKQDVKNRIGGGGQAHWDMPSWRLHDAAFLSKHPASEPAAHHASRDSVARMEENLEQKGSPACTLVCVRIAPTRVLMRSVASGACSILTESTPPLPP